MSDVSANWLMQDIAEFLTTQFEDFNESIILSCNRVPYLQIPEIAFFLIKSLSYPILLNRMSKVSSLGKTESAETAAAETVEFDESVLSLITERIICS